MTLQNGTRLGPYEILAPLGAGGMGEVFFAQDTELDRRVALKILPSESSDPERLRRFIREAKTASALNHPNIATVYEVREAEGVIPVHDVNQNWHTADFNHWFGAQCGFF